MKILIKDRKWNMFIGNIVLVCEVHEKNGIFSIEFPYKNQKVSLKSDNIDKTLHYLETIFLDSQMKLREKSA